MAEQIPGWIVILNGAPRSGKSSIARAMQERLEGIWMNLGVDVLQQAAPIRLQPSIGLRPGGERPDIEQHLPTLFAALYDAVAAHSRLGLNVVVDIGHHEGHSTSLHILRTCMHRLSGLPLLLVGIRCPLHVILDRRAKQQVGRKGLYEQRGADGRVPAPIIAWQDAVHVPGIYDLEVDTSVLSPEACCDQIADTLRHGLEQPSAAERLLAYAV